MGYLYLSGTVLLTVYGQLVLKWRLGRYGALPDEHGAKFWFVTKLFLDPFILSGLAGAFLASIFWMAAMTRFDVSYAYPLTSSAFILVLVFSVLLFNEPLTWHKVAGVVLVMAGIAVASQSR